MSVFKNHRIFWIWKQIIPLRIGHTTISFTMIYCFKFILLSSAVFLLNYYVLENCVGQKNQNRSFCCRFFVFTQTTDIIYILAYENMHIFWGLLTRRNEIRAYLLNFWHWVFGFTIKRLRFPMKLQIFSITNWFYGQIIYGKSMCRTYKTKKIPHLLWKTIVEFIRRTSRLEIIMEAYVWNEA